MLQVNRGHTDVVRSVLHIPELDQVLMAATHTPHTHTHTHTHTHLTWKGYMIYPKGANFSFVAPSSEELWVRKEIDQNALL